MFDPLDATEDEPILRPELRESLLAFRAHVERACQYAPNRASEDGDEPETDGEDIDYDAFLEQADLEFDEWRLERRRNRRVV